MSNPGSRKQTTKTGFNKTGYKKRGLSEIVSAVIIIAIVVAGMSVYVIASQQNILSDTRSVTQALDLTENQLSELLQQVEMVSASDGNVTRAIVFNYGTKNITISDLFVNGTRNMTIDDSSRLFFVRDLLGNNITNSQNTNTTIPMDKTVEIVVNFTKDTGNAPPDTVENLVIRTDSNNLIRIANSSTIQ